MLGLDLDYQYDLDQAHKAGVEEGLEQGIKRGVEQGLKQGVERQRIEDVKQIISKLGYSPESALELLDIPEREWPFYLELLDS